MWSNRYASYFGETDTQGVPWGQLSVFPGSFVLEPKNWVIPKWRVAHVCRSHSLRSSDKIIYHQYRWVVTEAFRLKLCCMDFGNCCSFSFLFTNAVSNSMLFVTSKMFIFLRSRIHPLFRSDSVRRRKKKGILCTLAQIWLHVLRAQSLSKWIAFSIKCSISKMCSLKYWPRKILSRRIEFHFLWSASINRMSSFFQVFIEATEVFLSSLVIVAVNSFENCGMRWSTFQRCHFFGAVQ